MTLVGALLRANLNDATVPISAASIGEWLGGERTLAGVSVTESKAYGLTGYFRAVNVLANTFASTPIKVYQLGTRKAVDRPQVLENPNPGQTRFEFWQTMGANGVSWGNCFARKVRDGGDVVVEAWPIHPSNCDVKRVKPTKAVPDGKIFEVVDVDGTRRELTSWEVFHLPYLSPHGYKGLSPLGLARQVLGIGLAAEETAGRFYGKGTMLSGILKAKDKLTPEQRIEWKKSWREKASGLSNAGDIAILDNGGEFQSLSMPPKDAELLGSRQFTVTEIARLFGLPPVLLMDLEKSTSWGTGIEQQMIGLVQFTLLGWFTAIQQRVTRELLPGGMAAPRYYAEYTIEGLLKGDSAARAAFYHQQITDGVLSRNEVRELENREPVEGGDEYLVPSNMTLVSIDGEFKPLSAAGQTQTGEG